MPDVLPVGVQNELYRGKPEMREEIMPKKEQKHKDSGGFASRCFMCILHCGMISI